MPPKIIILVALCCVSTGTCYTMKSPWTQRLPLRRSAAQTAASDPSHLSPLPSVPVGWKAPSPAEITLAGAAALVAYARPVPLADRVFSVAYPAYLYAANRLRFDRNAPAADRKQVPPLREGRGPWFGRYVVSFAMAGLLIPLVLQVVAPEAVSGPAAPHLYLTLCQCFMEALISGPGFYALIQLLVPIGFNAYRMGSLWTWLSKAWLGFVTARKGGTAVWETVGMVLAAANMVMWTYNLFVFLLLRTVPQYLDRGEFPHAHVMWKWQVIPVVDR